MKTRLLVILAILAALGFADRLSAAVTIPWNDVSKAGSSLADLTTRNFSSLQNVNPGFTSFFDGITIDNNPVGATDYLLFRSAVGGLRRVRIDSLISQGSVVWNDIGDATSNGNIALGNSQQSWTSTLDNGVVLGIVNLDTDRSSETTMLGLYDYDSGDADAIYLSMTGDSNGSPDIDYSFSQTGMYSRFPITVGTGNVQITDTTGNVLSTIVVVTPTGNLVATTAQAAFAELDAETTTALANASAASASASAASADAAAALLEAQTGEVTEDRVIPVLETIAAAVTIGADDHAKIYTLDSPDAETQPLPNSLDQGFRFFVTNINAGVWTFDAATTLQDEGGNTIASIALGRGQTAAFLNKGSDVWQVFASGRGVTLHLGLNALNDDTYEPVELMTGRDAGETVTQWQAVYLKSDGKFWLADANASGKFDAWGVAVASSSADVAITVLRRGTVRNDGWAWSNPGVPIYVSETVGDLTETAPSTAADGVKLVGYAQSDDEVYFDFGRPVVVVATP